MEIQNRGILISKEQKASDYVYPKMQLGSVVNYAKYLPNNEDQFNTKTDFLCCTTESMLHSIETQMNYLMAEGLLWDEAINFFRHNNCIVNGKFKFSVRYNAKMNGTDITKGQYQNVAGDHVRIDGLAADGSWPMSPTMTFEEYYSPMYDSVRRIAQKALWFIQINYQWVDKKSVVGALSQGPVQIATAVCPGWDSGAVVPKCTGFPIQHATMAYGVDSLGNIEDFDSYPPYTQKLSRDYDLPSNMQYLVTARPITLRMDMQGTNVLDMQERLMQLGYKISNDSFFGTQTLGAVVSFQKLHGLVADGIAGPLTLGKLKQVGVGPASMISIIASICTKNGIPPQLGIEVARAESNLNPNSKLFNPPSKSTDRGLFQINDVYHKEVTDAEAYDPLFATQWFCTAVNGGHLHEYYSASQPVWSKKVDPAILSEYIHIK